MTTESNSENTPSSAVLQIILDEVLRQGRVIDEIEKLIPVMKKAATFVDNPAGKFRDMARFRKGS